MKPTTLSILSRDCEVLTVFVKEGITIKDKIYDPMSLEDALELWKGLCEDCKELLRGAISKELYNDFFWTTMYNHYTNYTGCDPEGTRCKHCEGITKVGNNVTIPGSPVEGITFTLTLGDEEEDTGGYRGDPGNDLYSNLPSPQDYYNKGAIGSVLRGWISYAGEDALEGRHILESMGITVGKYDEFNEQFDYCVVTPEQMVELDKHFGEFTWSLD